jgi:2,3-bisphosphoglycerate-dependent phosphoglycerate mutase
MTTTAAAAAAVAASASAAGAPAAAAASAAVVRLYIFRHGVSEWNLLKKWQGVQDTQLAPEGIAQAKEAAAALADGGLRFQRAFSSDLCRARQTAEILSAACSDEGAGELRLDARLRECSLGRFEGMKRDDIKGPNGQYRQLFDDLVSLQR